MLKGLWADGPFTFMGKHYSLTNYDSQPKPMQRPHPPIFLGGGGKRLLSFAARGADIIGILARSMPAGDGLDRAEETEAHVAEKVEWIREAAGDRFERLELAYADMGGGGYQQSERRSRAYRGAYAASCGTHPRLPLTT